MKSTTFYSFAAFFLLFISVSCGTKRVIQNEPYNYSGQTQSLFNGKNLDGWYKFVKGRGRDIDPKTVFSVKDGMIHVSGEEYGCITTNEEYSNYKLVVEFKWGEKTYAPRVDRARDGGILLHSTGADGGYSGTWMYSIECQIIEGGTGDFLVVGDGTKQFSLTSNVAPKTGKGNVYQADGQPLTINSGRIDWWGRDPEWKDVLGFRGKQDVEKEVGKWNRVECIVKGDKVSAYLNGVLVNEAYNVRPTKGKIQLQSEGAEMFFRKVEITPIAAD